jgi:outer membrane protein TolC
MNYTIPRDLFNELVKNIGKESAEKFADAFERFLNIFAKEVENNITEKKQNLKAEIYNELRSELATKEFVRAEINEVRAEINEVRAEINEVRAEIQKNNMLLKILIGISLFALTVFNPNFVTLIEKIMKN